MKNWVKHKIIDFCYTTDFVANGSFASLRENVKYLKLPDYAVLVRLTDFTKKWKNDFIYVSKSAYDFLKKSSLLPNDLIMSNVGEPGIVFLVPDLKQPMTLGPNSILIRPSENKSTSKFLYMYFLSEKGKKQIGEISSGAAQRKFNKTSFRELEIPLPPLPEQKRIVKILDKAFAAIDEARANTEKNLQNSKELFDSYLNKIFSNPGEDWDERKLGEVCEFVRGPFGGSLKKNIFKKDGYAVYEQRHAIYDQFEDIRYFIDDKKFNEMRRFELSPGDLIMSCSGTMGKMAIVPENIKRGIINQALLKLTPTKRISVEFLKLWMQSESFQESLKTYSQGAAIQNVASVKILKEIMMPVPSMKEQRTIIQELVVISTETKKLESTYQKKIDNLEELKKSVLQKAFSGELKTTKAAAV